MRKGLASVEQDAAFKVRTPHHLHFHQKLPAQPVGASNVHHRHFEHGQIGQQCRIDVLDTDNGFVFGQWQKRIQKTDQHRRMLAKHLFERNVVFGVEVVHGQGLSHIKIAKIK